MSLRKRYYFYMTRCIANYTVDDTNKVALGQVFDVFENYKEGVLLMGATGTGKSIIFEGLRRILHHQDKRRFIIKDILDIVRDYNVGGSATLQQYQQVQNLVIDDLGREQHGKHYGNEINIVDELIQIRYNKFINEHALTHFTSNLNVKEIELKYDIRTCQRIGEMCRVIVMDNPQFRHLKNEINWLPVIHEVEKKDEHQANKTRIGDVKQIGEIINQRHED